MTNELQRLCWPAARLGDALEALCRTSKIRIASPEVILPPQWTADEAVDAIDEWLQAAAHSFGIEAKTVETPYTEVAPFLAACSPALLRIECGDEVGFLAVARSRPSSLRVVAPDLQVHRIAATAVRDALTDPLETPLAPEIEAFLEGSGVRPRRRRRVAHAILRQGLASARLRGFWLVRTPSDATLMSQVREAGLIGRVALFVGAHSLDYLLSVLCWWVIGSAALQGRLDFGWLAAWALLLLTRIPLQSLASWTEGVVAIRAGGILKRRMLAGSLGLEPEEVRTQGAGQMLGRVIESEALESLALSGGLTGALALVQVALAAGVLILGSGTGWLSLLLVAWVAALSWLVWLYFRERERWTADRLSITNHLVEKMVGHRTRVAQEPREQWHDGEDRGLERYLERCERLDRSMVRLASIGPRGFMLAGLLVLAHRFVSGSIPAGSLAVAFGGMILAQSALKAVTDSLSYITGAAIAWRQVKPLFGSGVRAPVESAPPVALLRQSLTRAVLQTRDLTFRYPGRPEKAIAECSLRIGEGDRILIEGPSGGGKSTLAALLAGLRRPESGLMTLRGIDLQTLGEAAWRRLVACAPQFHENHVFSATFAFNLLMGRRWPARPEDLEEAEAVCREIGLGQLLDRMPAGLQQMIGETGWQLSYGERTRLFLARALLQSADLVILDESFGALDPETLHDAAACVDRRAPTLMLIAHP
jgi:ATP-binding cassette subfamily B protein